VSIITSSGRAVRERPRQEKRPLVAVLSDGHRHRHGVGSAVLRQLDGLGVDLALIGCDAGESALLESWRNRDVAAAARQVVDAIAAEVDAGRTRSA
jgi:predicted methyltransferase MtxX (methanogen marker protein 4)